MHFLGLHPARVGMSHVSVLWWHKTWLLAAVDVSKRRREGDGEGEDSLGFYFPR